MNMKISSLDQELGIVISTREKTSISEPERIEVANLFSSSSLILFRGFDMDTEGFKRFTESLSTNFMSYVGGGYRRKMINGDETLLSVNGSGNEEDTSMGEHPTF